MTRRGPRTRVLLALVLLLAGPAVAELPATEMLHVVFRVESPDLPPTHFAAQPKAIWRVGMRLLRVEERHNPETDLHLLVIARAPDSWMINRRTGIARHIVDPGPSIDVHIPIVPVLKSGKIRTLEFGNELAFFRRHGAVATRKGNAGQEWRLTLEEHRLTLHVDASNRPQRLLVQGPENKTYTIVYERYERSPRIDHDKFKLPPGLTIEKAGPEPSTPYEP